MARRRGARAGRGWDAIPPRPAADDPQGGAPRRAGRGRATAQNRYPTWPRDAYRVEEDQAQEDHAGNERSDADLAREICLRQLAVRPRTRAELAQTLAGRRIDDEVIIEVLDRYDEVGMIDDAAFARAWVSSRHAGRGLARRALAGELRQRGVAGDLVGEALETLDDEQEAATARALVDRKLRTATGPPEAVFRRLVGMLARKGYPAGLAITTVKEALATRDAEAAEFAEQIDPDALAAAETGESGEAG
jgi:regulatory protein